MLSYNPQIVSIKYGFKIRVKINQSQSLSGYFYLRQLNNFSKMNFCTIQRIIPIPMAIPNIYQLKGWQFKQLIWNRPRRAPGTTIMIRLQESMTISTIIKKGLVQKSFLQGFEMEKASRVVMYMMLLYKKSALFQGESNTNSLSFAKNRLYVKSGV